MVVIIIVVVQHTLRSAVGADVVGKHCRSTHAPVARRHADASAHTGATNSRRRRLVVVIAIFVIVVVVVVVVVVVDVRLVASPVVVICAVEIEIVGAIIT